uniref:Uncharacterized protein n=1 Tax=Ixodes ricinus TaxID=34613 RepID=A0A6B0UH37_IXORI
MGQQCLSVLVSRPTLAMPGCPTSGLVVLGQPFCTEFLPALGAGIFFLGMNLDVVLGEKFPRREWLGMSFPRQATSNGAAEAFRHSCLGVFLTLPHLHEGT